jgi:hypothetical protein
VFWTRWAEEWEIGRFEVNSSQGEKGQDREKDWSLAELLDLLSYLLLDLGG